MRWAVAVTLVSQRPSTLPRDDPGHGRPGRPDCVPHHHGRCACACVQVCVGTVGAVAGGPGADGGCARDLACVVDLAGTRVGRGRGYGGDPRVRTGQGCVRPARGDAWVRLAGQPAGCARRSLGLGVVSGDRPLWLPPRAGLLHVGARRVLSALSARPARAVRSRPAGGARRRAAFADGVCVCAVRHPSSEHSGVGRVRAPRRG